MKKSVITINDELGIMALGFSKAGYDVQAIFIDPDDKLNYRICKDNWGESVYPFSIREEYSMNETCCYGDIDCIAGRVSLTGGSTAGKKSIIMEHEKFFLKEFEMIKAIRPKCFIFQYKKNNELQKNVFEVTKKIEQLGYIVNINFFDTKKMTGYPVKEIRSFLIGCLNPNDINLEFLEKIDRPEYEVNDFYDTNSIKDEWYYKINCGILQNIEIRNQKGLLCWSGNHYREEEYIKWNSRMIPLIIQGSDIRRITLREVARLKGIPDEYKLIINNKYLLYDKMIRSTNVQLIQQLASSLCLGNSKEDYFSRKAIKGKEFEKIIYSVFTNKGIHNEIEVGSVDSFVDFQYNDGKDIYLFEFKIYNSNVGINNKIIVACKRLVEHCNMEGATIIFIVANIIDIELKQQIEEKYKVFIWDIENILWMLEEFPLLKSDFVSLLSFNISEIIPQKPKQDIFSKTKENIRKIDFQERLRTLEPGKSNWNKYEVLCIEIIKFLFSDNIEFFKTQKKSNNGLYRFDCCGKIKHGKNSGFFDTVEKFFRTRYIIFEFKNYEDAITQKEIYTTEKYLYEIALRKVAIIISRKGMDENAQKASHGSFRESGKLILCLSDEDINKLIDMKNNNEDPACYLEVLLDNMFMQLEK